METTVRIPADEKQTAAILRREYVLFQKRTGAKRISITAVANVVLKHAVFNTYCVFYGLDFDRFDEEKKLVLTLDGPVGVQAVAGLNRVNTNISDTVAVNAFEQLYHEKSNVRVASVIDFTYVLRTLIEDG